MLFRRKIYDKLKEWKLGAAGEKALPVEGARRAGKPTIAGEFGGRSIKVISGLISMMRRKS